MKTFEFALVTLGLLLALGAGCNSDRGEPSKNQSDAGQRALRIECDAPTTSCDMGCIKRDEPRYCPSCCFEQMILCNGGKPYSFESCEKAETTPRH